MVEYLQLTAVIGVFLGVFYLIIRTQSRRGRYIYKKKRK